MCTEISTKHTFKQNKGTRDIRTKREVAENSAFSFPYHCLCINHGKKNRSACYANVYKPNTHENWYILDCIIV